jgi:hypothetical protein
LAKAQENPFKLPTFFEALKKGVIDSLNSHEKEMSYGGTKALKYDLRKIDKDLHIGLDIEEKWARDGDKKWSEYRKSLVDSRNYTPEQKSRILAAFDGYLKEKIEKPIDFKYASLGVPSVWSGRLDEANKRS